MIRRSFTIFSIVASLLCPAAAQERVTVGTMRSVANSALFLAVARNYFKAEGLDVEMTAYSSDQDVVQALAGGATDFAVAGFTAAAFNLAGSGAIKALAAQVRERNGYEGHGIIASNVAYSRGVRKIDNLSSSVIAIDQEGSLLHYQTSQIVRAKKFSPFNVIVKPQGSISGIVNAIRSGRVDAGIVPVEYARDMMAMNDGKLIGWYSDVDEQQLGALFASNKTLTTRREVAVKFVRAYRRAVTEYSETFMRHDSSGKRMSNKKSAATAATIARYVFPGRSADKAILAVEGDAYFMDPKAQLDLADIKRQVEWHQAQGQVKKTVDAGAIVDLSLLAPGN